MDSPLTPDVADSPAARVLRDLRNDGFIVELTSEGAVAIAPRSRLTPRRMLLITTHKEALKAELRQQVRLQRIGEQRRPKKLIIIGAGAIFLVGLAGVPAAG